MKAERIIAGAAAWALAASVQAADAIGNVGDVKLKGYLGQRLDAMVERHVGGTDIDYITARFQEKTERKGWWQTEFWGKYMHSAVPYAVYSGSSELAAKVAHGVDRILASQEPNGYIGNYPDDLRMGEGWDVWGVKYTMMGLLHYYDMMRTCGTHVPTEVGSRVPRDRATEVGSRVPDVPTEVGSRVPDVPTEVGSRVPRDRALDACRKLCDYVIAEIGPGGRRGRELWQTGNWSGYASSSILEPVVWLYRRTGDKKYLDFASYIVEGMTKPEKGPRLLDLALTGVSVADRNDADFHGGSNWAYVCKHGRSKAYEMMSCYQGILDYVEEKVKVEGEGEQWKNLRQAAIKTGEDIAKEEVNLAGGCACSEAWFHGARKQHLPYVRLQETCVTTTWMRFCEKLLETTGDPKWADQIERTFYNAYLGALKPDGSVFAAYTPLAGNRWRGMDHCYMHTDCCTANGPRGFLVFLRRLCERTGDTTTFNFYATAIVPGFDMYALYPRNGFARIVSHTQGARTVRLRIPGWCPKATVKLNGEAQPGVKPGAYFVLTRTWTLGDVVEVEFDMPVVAHTLGHHVAFTRGPVLLARDSRFGDGDLAEPFRDDIGDCRRAGLADGQVVPTFAEVRAPSSAMWMAFSATLPIGSHHENPEAFKPTTVFFCDYASAGGEWRRENYYRTWFPVEYAPGE